MLVAAFAVASSVSLGAGSSAIHPNGTPALHSAADPPLPLGEYNVTFSESGLSAAALTSGWAVTFNNTATTGHTGYISFTVENGTYNATNDDGFSITTVPAGYVPTPGSGAVTVDGANVTVQISFVQWHTITFTEAGLPATAPGQVWAVYVANDVDSSLANNSPADIVFTLNNTWNGTAYYGNYTYSVLPVPGFDFVVTPGAGCGANATGVTWCNVTQADAAVLVTFHTSPQFALQFNETGLAPGTSWSVTVNGATIIDDTSTITFGLTNGTYSFVIGLGGTQVVVPGVPPVNESNPTTGTVVVAGATVQNISFFPYSPITIGAFFTTSFTTNGFSYFELPYNITWTVQLTNATMTALNAAGAYAFQQQLNISVLQPLNCGPEPFQHSCLTVWTTIVPFSFHTDLTATSANFYFDLTAANLTGTAPSSITGPCPFGTFGCGNPYVGEVLPQNQWEVSLWINWDNNTAYNNSNTVTAHIGYMVVTSPYPQISTPTGNITEGVVTVAGNFSGYFVTGAVLTIFNSTNYAVLTAPVYSPGVTSHAYQVTWHAQVPGAYTIILNLSTPWFLHYTAEVQVTVLPGVPLTYFNSTGLNIAGLGAGGSGAFLVIIGAIIGMIVMALVARGLWGGTKPQPAQPWSPAAPAEKGSTDTTTGGTGGGTSGGGTMDSGMGGTSGSGGMSGSSGGTGGSNPPS